jgi:hypothetical protein
MSCWLCLSLAFLVPCSFLWGATVDAPVPAGRAAQAKAPHANETLLAGLRPGKDNLANAKKRFKAKELSEDSNSGYKEWRDDCYGRAIRLELSPDSMIQSISITTLAPKQGVCSERRPDFLDAKNWVTGLGLRLGDSQDRVTALYGEPNSSGPAAKNGQDLDLMFYQFDWAGSEVPQVMEVLCARDSGRVVEITLAFPSL